MLSSQPTQCLANRPTEGVRELIYLARDKDHHKQLFSEFEGLTVGHQADSMFDMTSNFHWNWPGRTPLNGLPF